MKDNVSPLQKVKTLETEVKEFVNSQPYWAKYLCSEILAGNEITELIINNSYSHLLQELRLKDKTNAPELPIYFNPNASDDFRTNLLFKSLEKVEGVNALSENQIIELTKNLTIIYGTNGAGKSGYTRLLKKVFYSKDKSNILPNINVTSGNKPISATFKFTSDADEILLKYPEDSENGIFNQFSVFDGDVGKKHLSVRNDFSFRPASLQFFGIFNASLEKLHSMLQNEISNKNTTNPFMDDDIFRGESSIKNFLIQLSHESNLDNLNIHRPYTEKDKENKLKKIKFYDDLKISLAQKEETIKKLRTVKEQLLTKKEVLLKINGQFNTTKLNSLIADISDLKSKEEIASKEGIKKFESYNIQGIGTIEWKKFIEAAQNFVLIQGENEYPILGDDCIFCQQELNDDSKINLIYNYWEYIKSVAEQEAKSAKEKLTKTKLDYEKINLNQFPETDILTIWLEEKHKKTLITIVDSLKKQEELSEKIIKKIDDKNDSIISEIQLDLSVLDTINNEIGEEIEAFEKDEKNKKLNELLNEITYLNHKEKLSDRYKDIKELHENLIWKSKANKFNKSTFKSQSTNTEKRLSKDYFNADYINAFNNECEILNGKFGIEIDAKSSDAKSNRQLFLKKKDPSEILSEGEQRVIALADFIAETIITPINKGLIFDDPVNSLDEKRKSLIAKRLVSLSEEKQVIIFTHDLVFVSSLMNYAQDKMLIHECHWIENRNGKPGQVWLKNSPVYEKVYRNAEPARNFHTKANKDDCPPEQRESLIKNGFTALRTCYEVLVINDLFKNVVQRYNERVSVDSLSSVYFDEALINELLESFAQCCRYMEGHTHSDKYAYTKPEPANLNEEIQRYDALRNKIKKFKKQ